MKILHLVSGDLWAGAEVQLYHLAKNLVEVDGINLLVIVLNEGQLATKLKESGVAVEILDETLFSSFDIFKQLLKISRQFKPNAIHTHRKKENVIGGVVSTILGCKSVRTVHGASEFSNVKRSLLQKSIDALDTAVAFFFQDKVIAVSDELKSKLEVKCYRKKLEVIENCVDIEFVKKMSLMQINSEIKAGKFNVVFVGRFVDVKRTDLFVDIASKVKKNDLENNIMFYMIGDGPLWKGIQSDVQKLGLHENVKLLGFLENTAPILNKMNLLMFTSDHEGLPMTLLEAMSLEVPVASRNLPTVKQVLCEGKCGYVFDSDEPEDIANEIIEISNDISGRNFIANKAYQAVLDRYSINSLVNRYYNLYLDLVSKNN